MVKLEALVGGGVGRCKGHGLGSTEVVGKPPQSVVFGCATAESEQTLPCKLLWLNVGPKGKIPKIEGGGETKPKLVEYK